MLDKPVAQHLHQRGHCHESIFLDPSRPSLSGGLKHLQRQLQVPTNTHIDRSVITCIRAIYESCWGAAPFASNSHFPDLHSPVVQPGPEVLWPDEGKQVPGPVRQRNKDMLGWSSPSPRLLLETRSPFAGWLVAPVSSMSWLARIWIMDRVKTSHRAAVFSHLTTATALQSPNKQASQ